MRKSLLLLPLLLPLAASANECRFQASRDFQIDPAGLRALAAELGSSDLHAEGIAGLTHIEVHGKACASDQVWLAELDIAQSREGDRIKLTPSHTEHSHSVGLFHSSYAYIDIEVRMPLNLPLEVRSSSGDAVVDNLAALDFSASSGDLQAKHIAGAVAIKVSSGDARISDVGSIELHSVSSGDIKANDVHGDIKVGHVGSGDLEFADVAGSIRIEKVGSGDVTANRVKGDVSVGSIGSGDVRVDGIDGNFSVSAKGSGEIQQKNVSGRVDVPRERDH